MSDTLVIGGNTYTGVTGVKATDGNNNTKTYIRPEGNLPITSNSGSVDVSEYATVSVNVTPNLQLKSVTYTPSPSEQSNLVIADAGYDGLAQVIVHIDAATGSSKNAQAHQSTTRATSSSYTSVNSFTCTKAGTYTVYWSTMRSSTSGTWGSQLYINGTAHGSAQTGSWSNHVQNIKMTGVSIGANQTVAVYARSRGNSYYAYVPLVTIIEE